jgi:hypothetical protein
MRGVNIARHIEIIGGKRGANADIAYIIEDIYIIIGIAPLTGGNFNGGGNEVLIA